MTVIKVPRPPQSAMDLNRPISSLLKKQVEYLYEAEKRLPTKYQSEIYINAIKTEGEAANYTRAVTEAIRSAHGEAAAARTRRAAPARKRVIEIAAVADEAAERRRRTAGRRTRKSERGTRKT